jgi:hypothetical protein
LLSIARPPIRPGKSIRPTQQGFAGAPPLAVPHQAFNPLPFFLGPSRNGTGHDETSRQHDELNIWLALVIGD